MSLDDLATWTIDSLMEKVRQDADYLIDLNLAGRGIIRGFERKIAHAEAPMIGKFSVQLAIKELAPYVRLQAPWFKMFAALNLDDKQQAGVLNLLSILSGESIPTEVMNIPPIEQRSQPNY